MADPHRTHILASLCLSALLFLASSGCSKTMSQQQTAAPLDVEVVRVEPKDVPTSNERIGTLDGTINAEIKAQVTGYLRSREYEEGSYVTKGQVLFEIDPRPLQAALDQARAALNEA